VSEPAGASTPRLICGWAAVALSTFFAGFWAFWGSIETFHEGWYHRSIWMNLALTVVQYLSPMLLIMLPAVVSIRRPKLGAGMYVAVGTFVTWFFKLYDRPGVAAVLAAPVFAVALLYAFGRPEPRRWAFRIAVGVPLATALVSGAYPGWLAVQRHDDGDYGLRIIEGNGVRLAWAPEGPGWPERPVTWGDAQNACEHLSRDGRRILESPQGIWRLPTVEEAVRSSVRGGKNAGGTWDREHMRPSYRVQPNKDTPLWKRYSPAIYRWTSTPHHFGGAYRVTYNGYANGMPRQSRLYYRCVADPAAVTGAD
jgi:hypothetical protein